MNCLSAALACILFASSFYEISDEGQSYIMEQVNAITESQEITYTIMELEYIGDHYITAYCPEECGYNGYNYPSGWITSTGTIAHREEEWWKPSTCGIATDYHSYGELFLIDGKVYQAEDTGYISGAWIDIFMPSYEEMMQHGSHWTEVYSVDYIELEPVRCKHLDINDYIGCPYQRRMVNNENSN